MSFLSKAEIRETIENAFDRVALDGGTSLEQAKVIDNYGRGVTSEQLKALAGNEIIDNWSMIPHSTLDDAENIAHLDAKGFRYYIPAFMLRVLDNYTSGSMLTIGTLLSLYPKTKSGENYYALLSNEQRTAIALYMRTLPRHIELRGEDKTVVERAYRNYWSRYVESNEI